MAISYCRHLVRGASGETVHLAEKKMDKTENRNALIYKVSACPFSVQ